MWALKEVKPARFKDKDFQRIMRNALRKAAKDVKKDYEALVGTWEHKPSFKMETHLTPGLPSPSIEVYADPGGPNYEIWVYVNKGTRPHDIWAGAYTGKSKAKVLVFPSQFTPKTRPRSLSSGSGGRGGSLVKRPHVRHPGTQPREFDKQMSKRWKPRFKRRMEKAMSEATKASGHQA